MNAILHNPYHYSGAMVARVGVAGVTALWSILVLSGTDALAPTAYGPALVQFAHENVYGLIFLSLSGALLVRAFLQTHPRWYVDGAGYFSLFASWAFVDAIIWFAHRPIQPTSASTVTLTTALALYAALAMPRGVQRVSGD
mgnify:CR=1 FL=1